MKNFWSRELHSLSLYYSRQKRALVSGKDFTLNIGFQEEREEQQLKSFVWFTFDVTQKSLREREWYTEQ